MTNIKFRYPLSELIIQNIWSMQLIHSEFTWGWIRVRIYTMNVPLCTIVCTSMNFCIRIKINRIRNSNTALNQHFYQQHKERSWFLLYCMLECCRLPTKCYDKLGGNHSWTCRCTHTYVPTFLVFCLTIFCVSVWKCSLLFE